MNKRITATWKVWQTVQTQKRGKALENARGKLCFIHCRGVGWAAGLDHGFWEIELGVPLTKNISFKESGALGGGRERGSLCLWRSDPRGLQTWVLTLNSSLFRVYSACSNFQTTCRVLGILLYIALFPTVSHYSMKLQSVCTRSPGLPLPTRAGSSFMVQRTKPLIGDMLQKTARERRTTFITFPSPSIPD